MSALASPQLPSSLRGDLQYRADDEFLPVQEAARRLRVSEGHLRRLCPNLAAKGTARLIRMPSGGRSCWHIHRSHDPRLIDRVDAPASDIEDLTRWPAQKVAVAHNKLAVLRAYRLLVNSGANLTSALPTFIAQQNAKEPGFTLSARTLRRWHQECPPVEATARAIFYFLDKRGGDTVSGSVDKVTVHPRAWEEFRKVYLTTLRWSVAKCWRHVGAICKREGWGWVSVRHLHRLVEERIDASTACLAREGEDAWHARFQAKLQQHPEAWAAGENWIGDHSRLDFFARIPRGGVFHARRLWVTTWTDWRTRKVVGWWIDETPSADTIRYALHDALKREGGPPRHAWIDNGKDYASAAIVGVTKSQRRTIERSGGSWMDQAQGTALLGLLGITAHFARPYNHDGKARIERFFGTMHGEFCKGFESYCGAKPGDVPVPEWVSKNPARLPSIDQVRAAFGKFVDAFNDRADHNIDDLRDDAGRRLSPNEAMRCWRTSVPILANPEALTLLLKRFERPLRVGKQGVGLLIGGRKVYYGAWHPELESFKGSDRLVSVAYDPGDMSAIHIFDEELRFLCVVEANGLYGGRDALSKKALVDGLNKQRQHQRAVRLLAGDPHVRLQSVIELGQDAQRELNQDETRARQAAGIGQPDPDLPSSMRLIQTPIDDQVKAVQNAGLRRAVGAENVTRDPLRDFDVYADADTDEHADDASACPEFSLADVGDDDDGGGEVVPQPHEPAPRVPQAHVLDLIGGDE